MNEKKGLNFTLVDSPAVSWKLEIDDDGDLVLYANNIRVLFISSNDGVLYRYSLGDESIRRLVEYGFTTKDRKIGEASE